MELTDWSVLSSPMVEVKHMKHSS